MPAKFLFSLTTALLMVCPIAGYGQSCTVVNQIACERMISSNPCMHYMCAAGPDEKKMKKSNAAAAAGAGAGGAHGDGAQHAGPPSQIYHCVEVSRSIGETCFAAESCIPRGTCDSKGACSGPQMKCTANNSAIAGVQCSCMTFQCSALCTDSACWNTYMSNHSVLDSTKVCSIAPGSPQPYVPAQ